MTTQPHQGQQQRLLPLDGAAAPMGPAPTTAAAAAAAMAMAPVVGGGGLYPHLQHIHPMQPQMQHPMNAGPLHPIDQAMIHPQFGLPPHQPYNPQTTIHQHALMWQNNMGPQAQAQWGPHMPQPHHHHQVMPMPMPMMMQPQTQPHQVINRQWQSQTPDGQRYSNHGRSSSSISSGASTTSSTHVVNIVNKPSGKRPVVVSGGGHHAQSSVTSARSISSPPISSASSSSGKTVVPPRVTSLADRQIVVVVKGNDGSMTPTSPSQLFDPTSSSSSLHARSLSYGDPSVLRNIPNQIVEVNRRATSVDYQRVTSIDTAHYNHINALEEKRRNHSSPVLMSPMNESPTSTAPPPQYCEPTPPSDYVANSRDVTVFADEKNPADFPAGNEDKYPGTLESSANNTLSTLNDESAAHATLSTLNDEAGNRNATLSTLNDERPSPNNTLESLPGRATRDSATRRFEERFPHRARYATQHADPNSTLHSVTSTLNMPSPRTDSSPRNLTLGTLNETNGRNNTLSTLNNDGANDSQPRPAVPFPSGDRINTLSTLNNTTLPHATNDNFYSTAAAAPWASPNPITTSYPTRTSTVRSDASTTSFDIKPTSEHTARWINQHMAPPRQVMPLSSSSANPYSRTSNDRHLNRSTSMNSFGSLRSAANSTMSSHREKISKLQQRSPSQLLDDGTVDLIQGLHEDAISRWTRAREVSQAAGDKFVESRAICNIACSYRLRGRFDEALATVFQAWVVAEECLAAGRGAWVDIVRRLIPNLDEFKGLVAARAERVRKPPVRRNSSAEAASEQPRKDPTTGPPIVVWMIELTGNVGNVVFASGDVLQAETWYKLSLRIAEETLLAFPIANSRSSPVRLSYLHRSCLAAKARALTHLALCEADIKMNGLKETSHGGSSFETAQSSQVISPGVSSPTGTISPPHLPFGATTTPAENEGDAYISHANAASVSAVLASHESDRDGSPSPLVRSLQAAISANSAIALITGSKRRLHQAFGMVVAAAEMYQSCDDELGVARVKACLGAVCLEVGRALDGVCWVSKFVTAGRSVDDASKRVGKAGRVSGPGLRWIESGVELLNVQIEKLKERRDWIGVASCYTNLGIAYTMLNQPHLALHFLSRTVDPVDPDLLPPSASQQQQAQHQQNLPVRLPANILPCIQTSLHQALSSLIATGRAPWYPAPENTGLPAPPTATAVNVLLQCTLLLTHDLSAPPDYEHHHLDVTTLSHLELATTLMQSLPTRHKRARRCAWEALARLDVDNPPRRRNSTALAVAAQVLAGRDEPAPAVRCLTVELAMDGAALADAFAAGSEWAARVGVCQMCLIGVGAADKVVYVGGQEAGDDDGEARFPCIHGGWSRTGSGVFR